MSCGISTKYLIAQQNREINGIASLKRENMKCLKAYNFAFFHTYRYFLLRDLLMTEVCFYMRTFWLPSHPIPTKKVDKRLWLANSPPPPSPHTHTSTNILCTDFIS